MLTGLLCLVAIALFMYSALQDHRAFASSYPDGPPIIPRMDTMIPKNDDCAPPICGRGQFDKRDLGIALPGCSKVFFEKSDIEQPTIEHDYFEKLDDQFQNYVMMAGSEKPFRDIYDSYDRLQQLVYQSPRDTLHEKTTNPRSKKYLTTLY